MLLTDCGCNNPCSNCAQVTPTPCTKDRCRKTLEVTKIAQLVWLQGLDEDLCERFMRLSDAVGLRDCAGNRVALETPVVLCSDFQAQLCAAIAGLASGGEAIVESTQLVGADCLLYTLPAGSGPGTETPNTAVDTSTIDMSATGTLGRAISGTVKVSGDAGNELEIHADGLFVPESSPATTACAQLQAFPVGADITAGMVLIGADCQKHEFPGIPSPGFTVTDTSSIDLTLVGTNLEADLRLDPTGLGTITGDGLLITCAEVLLCAPPVTVLDTQSINLTLVGQQVSAAAIIDPDVLNALELRPAGLFVDVCSALTAGNPPVPAVVGVTVLVGADCNRYTIPAAAVYIGGNTLSALVTVTGQVITADVHIQPGTLLTQGPLGLQVLCEAVQDCIFNTSNNFWSYNDVGNSVVFNPSSDAGNQITTGTDGRPFVASTALIAGDTFCIDLSIVAGVITANPIISAQPGNGLLCLADGLFTPTQDVTLTGAATDCLLTTVAEGPANTFEVSVFPIISALASNILQCTPQGLYVPAGVGGVTVVSADTNCIDVTVTEAPVGTFTVSADPIVDPNILNELQCTVNGLLVLPGAQTPISPIDTNSIDLTVSGVDSHTLQADVIISPDAGNALTVLANGLFVPPAPTSFTFTSPSNTVHTIVHNLNNAFPSITVWDTVAGDVIIPSTISSNGVNSLDITFFIATAIAGTVVG